MANAKRYPPEEVSEILKRYLRTEFLYDQPDVVLSKEFNLIQQGIMDSMGIFQLMTFLEEEFAFTVEPEDILVTNFETLGALESLVIRQLEASGYSS